MSTVTESFARRINRQRLAPRPWDYCYLLLRGNLAVFHQFLAQLPAAPRILDVGCGFKPWVPLLPSGAACVGVDYSSQWSAADALASGDWLPFREGTFDAVICSEVLEHTRYPERVLAELRRVCRNDGVLYITSPFAFHEHGIPYDFQRLTRFFYQDVFRGDQVLSLRETNSTFSTGLTCWNMFIESSPLRLASGAKHLFYTLTNLAGLVADVLMDLILPHVARSYKVYFHNMPLGYAMVVRIRKGSGSADAQDAFAEAQQHGGFLNSEQLQRKEVSPSGDGDAPTNRG